MGLIIAERKTGAATNFNDFTQLGILKNKATPVAVIRLTCHSIDMRIHLKYLQEISHHP